VIRIRRSVGTLLVSGLLVAGCGASGTDGASSAGSSRATPTAPTSPAPRTASTISTCEDLPPETIASLGVDPARRKNADLAGQKVSERGCSWDGKELIAGVSTTNATVALYKTRKEYAVVGLPVIAGLPSMVFQFASHPSGCTVISDVPEGGIIVEIESKIRGQGTTESCGTAVHVMETVLPVLLKSR
jgi:Protein of unknown function (DUF3558)